MFFSIHLSILDRFGPNLKTLISSAKLKVSELFKKRKKLLMKVLNGSGTSIEL